MRVSTIGNNLCFQGSALTTRTVKIFLHLVLVLVTSVLINICLTSLTRAKPKEKMEFPA